MEFSIRKLTKNFVAISSVAWVYVFTHPTTARAQTTTQPGTDAQGNVTTPLADPQSAWGLLGELFSMLFGLAIIGAAIIAFIYLIIGAFQWGTAGSGDGAAKGRKTMLYAAFGLIMVALVYVFMIFFNSLAPQAG